MFGLFSEMWRAVMCLHKLFLVCQQLWICRLVGWLVLIRKTKLEKKTSCSVTRELCRRRTRGVLLPVRVVPLQRDRRGRRVRKDLYFCVKLVQNSISSFLFLPGSASAPALVRRLRVVGGQKGRQESVGRGSRGRERSSRRKRSCTLGTGTSGRTWPVFNFIFWTIKITEFPPGGRGREVGEWWRGWVRLVQGGVGREEGQRGRGRAGGQPAVELLVQQLLDRCHRVAEVGLEHLAQHRLRVGGGLDYWKYAQMQNLNPSFKLSDVRLRLRFVRKVFNWELEFEGWCKIITNSLVESRMWVKADLILLCINK